MIIGCLKVHSGSDLDLLGHHLRFPLKNVLEQILCSPAKAGHFHILVSRLLDLSPTGNLFWKLKKMTCWNWFTDSKDVS